MLQLPLDIQLDTNARFDNFYQGDNGQLFDCLVKLSNLNQVNSQERFIYICGEQLSGKSHLAQALSHEFDKVNRGAIYFPLDNKALRPEVLKGLDDFDLVCLDGLHHVIGQPLWETAVFELYNALLLANRCFVIFSRETPDSQQLNLADLRSRLKAMLFYKLYPVNDEKKLEFMQYLAALKGLDLSDEVAQFILLRVSRETKTLVDLVKKLDEQSLVHQRRITIPFVKDILAI